MFICHFVSLTYKWSISDEEKRKDTFDTILCGLVGLVLGVGAYYFNPDTIHSDNVLAAAATGITSGLASVGVRYLGGSKNKKN